MQQQVMKRNMPSELGWGIGAEGGWIQHSSAPGSGSWTSTASQDGGALPSSWNAMSKSDSASDPGDDASSSKSGSTITSLSNATSQSQDTTNTSSTSSSSWNTSNPMLSSVDSGPWGSSSSPAPSGIGSMGWSTNPSNHSLSSNQSHHNNMQPGSNIGSSALGNASSSAGWPTSITGNNLTSTMPPSMNAGMQSNALSSQWQSSSLLGNIGDFSKMSDSGWNNPASSLLENSKDLGAANSDPRMWGLYSDKTSDSQCDASKNQWGNTLAAGSDQGASNTEMSFAQATLKGLKLPPVANVSQATMSSRHEEILRAVENHEGWGSRPIRQDTSWDIETSPKSIRSFSADVTAGGSNVRNNSNGTAIWEALRENQSSNLGGGGGSGGNSWNTEKEPPNWGGPPKPAPDTNTWNVQNNADPKAFGTWGATGGAGDASNKMWGQRAEVGSWGDNGGVQRTTSISSWGDDGDAGAWEDQRRMTSGMGGMQVMVPPSPGMCVPAGMAGMVPQGMAGMGMPTMNSDATSWNDGQKPGWNPASAATVTRTNIDEPWNKPPPSRSGWGDSAHNSDEVDNGTSIWASNSSKQPKASDWGDAGPQGQWNPAAAKPKIPSGWDEASWILAQRAKMPQKFISSGSNPPTQMRAKLLQHLMDMGFRKEEAQSALITNNMNVEMALNDLKAGNVNVSRKDVDMDVFQVPVSQSRIPYMSKGVLGGDDMPDIRSDQVPTFTNIQNTPFPTAQITNQPFMQNSASLPPSSLNINNSSITPSLQQKLMQKMQQQQAPPSTTLGQRGPIPPVVSSTNSQVSQQQILAQVRQAISNGFISPQLLNYQLPNNVLVLLQQLLQLQATLQTYMSKQQQLIQQARAAGSRSNPQLEQMAGFISTINQQIINVQKQLQQAQNTLFGNQKPPAMTQPPLGTPSPQTGVNMVDSLDALSTDLANVALHNRSRLSNQWKPGTDTSSATTVDITGTSTTSTTMKVNDENGENKAPGMKGLLQLSSSPNLNLIAGGLGMTGDKTWSSNMSTTSSSNWPFPTDNTGTISQTDIKPPNSTRTTTSLLSGLPSGLTDVIPEFVPGKPWQGLAKNIEDDPHVTPGSIQRSLSVNRVHDDSLNHLDGHKLGSSSWGTGFKTDNSLGLSQLGNRPPPGMAISKGIGGQQWPAGNINRQTSWPHSSNSAFTKVPGSGWNDSNAALSSWILLKNLTVDPSTVRALSAQHGTLMSFYSMTHGRFALVQYSNRDTAFVAQQRLNNFQMGTSVMSAEFISEADAQRIAAQIPPPQPSAMPVMNASPWSQAPPSTPFRGGDPWGISVPTNHFNSKFGTSNENQYGLWERPDNPYLLSNILGGE